MAAIEKECRALAKRLQSKFPDLQFEVLEDWDSPGDFYIALLSSGPDYKPEIESSLPEKWRFSGWENPDQRNNMGAIRLRLGH